MAGTSRARMRTAALAALALGVGAVPALGFAAPARAVAAAKCQYNFENRTPGGRLAKLPPREAKRAPYFATVVTNRGTIQIALNGRAAPCTVNSFLSLAVQRYYDGTPCHRLLNSSNGNRTAAVLQCGDPTGTGTGQPGYRFDDENLKGATYPKGTVAMANAGPGTNGSQFFMVFKDSDFPPTYTPFGTVTAGVEVLEKIAANGQFIGPTGSPDAPLLPVEIESVTVSKTTPRS
ncbi:MAG: peptidylprolyl isomerase [Sporichthyaceae bacterium]